MRTFCRKSNITVDEDFDFRQDKGLDFYTVAHWLVEAYWVLQETFHHHMPQFVACYTPSEMEMVLVADIYPKASRQSELWLYSFTWNEIGVVFNRKEKVDV